ncbi:hypothetical protein Btru_027627 [Bulinus truncatus]|nr:hypothetical protein Btru_027627 [Bulinus truncatus]
MRWWNSLGWTVRWYELVEQFGLDCSMVCVGGTVWVGLFDGMSWWNSLGWTVRWYELVEQFGWTVRWYALVEQFGLDCSMACTTLQPTVTYLQSLNLNAAFMVSLINGQPYSLRSLMDFRSNLPVPGDTKALGRPSRTQCQGEVIHAVKPGGCNEDSSGHVMNVSVCTSVSIFDLFHPLTHTLLVFLR